MNIFTQTFGLFVRDPSTGQFRFLSDRPYTLPMTHGTGLDPGLLYGFFNRPDLSLAMETVWQDWRSARMFLRYKLAVLQPYFDQIPDHLRSQFLNIPEVQALFTLVHKLYVKDCLHISNMSDYTRYISGSASSMPPVVQARISQLWINAHISITNEYRTTYYDAFNAAIPKAAVAIRKELQDFFITSPLEDEYFYVSFVLDQLDYLNLPFCRGLLFLGSMTYLIYKKYK